MKLARCPACQTVFRLHGEQLQAHGGKVRCGQCYTPFNALQHLIGDLPEETPAAPPTNPASPHPTGEPLAPNRAQVQSDDRVTDKPHGPHDHKHESLFVLEERQSDTPLSPELDFELPPPLTAASPAERSTTITAAVSKLHQPSATAPTPSARVPSVPVETAVPSAPSASGPAAFRNARTHTLNPLFAPREAEQPAPATPDALQPDALQDASLLDFGLDDDIAAVTPADPSTLAAPARVPDNATAGAAPHDTWPTLDQAPAPSPDAPPSEPSHGDHIGVPAAKPVRDEFDIHALLDARRAQRDHAPAHTDAVESPDSELISELKSGQNSSAGGGRVEPTPKKLHGSDPANSGWEAASEPEAGSETHTESESESEQQDYSHYHYGTVRPPVSSGMRWLQGLSVGVLLGVLIAQTAYLFREEITRQWPQLRPGFVMLCAQLSCEVPFSRSHNLINIETSDLQIEDGTPPRYLLNAVVRNLADYPQQYPYLEITLTDSRGFPVIRRALAPEEWLPEGQRVEDGFAGRSDLAVRLQFTTRGEMLPVGYLMYAFYP